MSKIVIIEDNELVARVYEQKLIKEGHLTGVALNGRQGLEMVRQINPDLVLVDLLLPEISGVEVIKELRNDPRFSKLVIIAYSADNYLLDQVKDFNPTKVFSKSQISPREIFSEIELVLSSADNSTGDSSADSEDETANLSPNDKMTNNDKMANSDKLKKFLIVEDDSIVLNIIKNTVEKLGYTAVCASDGREAYQIINKDSNFFTAIFDIELPHIKGTDLMKFMRTEKRFINIPIIIMTSNPDSIQTQIDSLSSGATFFINKPFTRQVLESIIKILVNKDSFIHAN